MTASHAIGTRRAVALGLLVAGAWAAAHLELRLGTLAPGAGGLDLALDFFSRALSPALESEARFRPPGAPPLLITAAQAAWTTVLFAAAAISLALPAGMVLGFLCSSAWWEGDPAGGERVWSRGLRRTLGPGVFVTARGVSAVARSVHELLWAVLFLVALGLNSFAAVLAIAIPYSGVFAKVFSELIDEAPRASAHALRALGARGTQVYLFGLVPSALPDLVAYAFYRLECAVRSSAILGFFGYPTLGLYIRQSFRSTNYGEVWTFLYVLLGLVVLFELWSAALRPRITT